jgi:oligopeptide/dipeptide ABC transporter ATP-binding protein
MKPVILEGEIPSPANPPSGCPFHPRCPYAQEVCKHDIPEWKEYRPGHFAACHFADTLSLKGAVKS